MFKRPNQLPLPSRHRILYVLRSARGAIDLASIMVGVIILGVIGGVIAATVFAVIPWTQNEAAKGSLEAIGTAEYVQFAHSTVNGDGRYINIIGLTTTDNASRAVLLSTTGDNIAILLNAGGTRYVAVSRSATGERFFLASDHTKRVLDVAEGLDKVSAFLGLDPAGLGGIWAP